MYAWVASSCVALAISARATVSDVRSMYDFETLASKGHHSSSDLYSSTKSFYNTIGCRCVNALRGYV